MLTPTAAAPTERKEVAGADSLLVLSSYPPDDQRLAYLDSSDHQNPGACRLSNWKIKDGVGYCSRDDERDLMMHTTARIRLLYSIVMTLGPD